MASGLLFVLIEPTGATPIEGKGPRVAEVKAHLVYDEDGAVDNRDLTTGKVALWNTPAGEGDAEKAASTILVIARVSPGNLRKPQPAKVALRVRVKGSKRIVSNENVAVRLGATKPIAVPYLVRGVGCEPLELEVAVDSGPPLSRTIPFNCGE